MKIVLLVLSGDSSLALEELGRRYPHALIEVIARDQLETGNVISRLNTLRARRPDLFVIATERLVWQQGQSAFMLFGTLAGAQQVALLDAYGGLRVERRGGILARAPARLARDAALSAATLARARKELVRLEREVSKRKVLDFETATPRPVSASAEESTKSLSGRLEKKRPAIVYLRGTPGPGTQAGGASSHIKGVVNALVTLGADVRLISNDEVAGVDHTNTRSTIIEPDSFGITRAVFDINNNMIFTRGIVPLIVHDPPDFIYQRYARFGWAGVAASLRSKRPLFLEYNGSEVWFGRHWDHVGRLNLLGRYERLNLAAAMRIFVVSDIERRNLERAGVEPEKIVVNPNGVDIEIFQPNVGGERVREQLGVTKGETLVGFVGTFGPWHGTLVLAEAIKLVPNTKQIRFLLIGKGKFREEVERILQKAGAADRVIFTGPVAHERVPAMLDACDVLVAPHVPLAHGADFFGSPTKLFEYMAMGRGIVASRLGQIAEVLTDEKTALLVEPGDARQLAAAIIRLADSRGLREQLGRAAREAAIARHTWTRNAQNVLDAYSTWLESSGQN